MSASRSLETLTAEDFRRHDGARFTLAAESAGVGSGVSAEVTLAEVTEFPAAPAGTFRAPFSVLFHGPLEPVLPQGIYRLEHELFKVPGLFIVPVGPAEPAEPGQAATAMRYQAVFG